MSSGLAITSLTRARARVGDLPPERSEPLLFLAALSLVIAVIHGVAAVPHMTEYPLYGGLFVVLGLFQAGWGMRIYGHPSDALLRMAVVVNLGVVLVWVGSRTVGLPVGPDGPGVPEQVGLADLAATLDELVLIGLALQQLRGFGGGELPGWAKQSLLVFLILGAVGAMAVGHSH